MGNNFFLTAEARARLLIGTMVLMVSGLAWLLGVSGTARDGSERPSELVIIDDSISDPGTLEAAWAGKPGIVVVHVPATHSTMSRIAQVAAQYGELQAIHIVSHGASARLQLGNEDIDTGKLQRLKPQIAQIGQSIRTGGSILFYGCNIGQGHEGEEFLRQFSSLAGHSVAASTDQTGAARLGGNWRLERKVGRVETAALAAEGWNAVLSQNNTGTWTLGTNTANNVITVGASSVTATVTFSGHTTATTTTAPLTNETFNGITVFSPAVQSTPSLGIQYNWDNTPETGTNQASDDGGTAVMTITFSSTVKDPILHLDRIGGSDGTNQNTSAITLQTGGISLTRLAGTGHFSVAGNVITNNLNGTAIGSGYTSESSTTTNLGTAAGSVRLNGTFTSVSFLLAPATGTTEGAGGDAIEVKLTYDPVPTAQPDSFTSYMNAVVSGNLYNNNGSGADSDFNTDTLTITQINGAAYTVGSPIALANGSLTITNATTGTFSFTPTTGFFGTQTFTYTIADANGGTSTATVTFTVQRTSLTLTKTSIGGVGGFTFTGTNGWSSQTITTVTSGVAATGATQSLAAPSTATTITETIPAGYYVSAISCSGLGGGTATPNLAAGSVTLNATATAAGNAITCSFTNTKLPTLQIRKISQGAVGSFSFSGTNGFGSDTITTVTQGATTNGTTKTLTAISTATTVTETIPSGYVVSSISCTGLGGGSVVVNTTAGTAQLDAAATAAGNAVVCTYTNVKLPTLQIRKISQGAVGSFSFSGTNGFGSDTITTVTQGATTNGTTKTLTTVSTATTVTETIPATYFISAISCTGLGAGSATTNLNTGVIQLDTAATAAGNTIVCTYTNTKEAPGLTVVKSANTAGPVAVGNVITYTFQVTNSGNRPITGIQIADTSNGTGSVPTPLNETLLTDAAPAGDSTDATSNNGVWSTLGPGDVIRFTATYTVTQSDIDTLQ